MVNNNYSAVIVSPDVYDDTINNLKNCGLNVVFSMQNKNVSDILSYHADMQIANINYTTYVCAPECYSYYCDILKNYKKNIVAGNTFLSSNYPQDIAYNIVITNSCAIHNFKYTDSVIKNYLANKNIINVSQGYCACTLCALGNNAFITSDRGLYKTLVSNNLDVLLIDDSCILLPGFDHGFIGGASVMINGKLLAVNGKIQDHPDYDNIKSFCLNYGICVESFSNNPIMDIGSFVVI